jgi:multiple sugar transport system substrate-binding protein
LSRAFGILIGIAAALYIGAEWTLQRAGGEEITLRWATDPNPARQIQTGTFARLNPGLNVEVDPGIGGDQTKLIVQCATGTGPDVVDTQLEALPTLVQAGVLLDLSPYAEEMGFSVKNTYPALSDALKVDGKQYAFPCNVWANAVIYNKAVFDDHGVPYPESDWSLEDFIRAGQGIRNNASKSGKKHLPVANWLGGWIVQDMFAGLGGRYFSEDGVVSLLDSRESRRAFRIYHELIFKHKVIPTAAELAAASAQGGWGSYGLTLFSSGRAAMLFCGRWYIVQAPNYPNLKGNLGAVALPRIDGRKSAGMAGTRCAGINVKSRHAQEALKFLAFLASPEYNRLIVMDGDALPPNPKLAKTGRDLVNEAVPDPAFHQVFIEAIARARPIDISPFIDFAMVLRWYNERVGEVENKLLTPDEACRKLAREINWSIRTSLERRLDLQAVYEKRTGRKYSSDWWRKKDPVPAG